MFNLNKIYTLQKLLANSSSSGGGGPTAGLTTPAPSLTPWSNVAGLLGNLLFGDLIKGSQSSVISSVSNAFGGKTGSAINTISLNLSNNIEQYGLKEGLTNFTNLSNLGGLALGVTSSALRNNSEYSGKKGGVTKKIDSVYDAVAGAAGFTPLGLGMQGAKVLGQVANKLGGGTDGMTTTDAILGSSLFSWNVGMVNGFGGKKTDTFDINKELMGKTLNSYSAVNSDLLDATLYSGKKYGRFSNSARKRANLLLHESGRKQNNLQSIVGYLEQAIEAMGNSSDIYNQQYLAQLNGGYNDTAVRAAKHGTKLQRAKRIAKQSIKFKDGGIIEQEWIPQPFTFDTSMFTEQVEVFKEGGKMNVIPEGALHKNKHHMEEQTPELKGLITEKGIPVIIEKEGGEVELQAEIEHSEIIFIKEVTEKLEKWLKEYEKEDTSQSRKDEISILAGKLLAKLIIENTDDRTNLIETVE